MFRLHCLFAYGIFNFYFLSDIIQLLLDNPRPLLKKASFYFSQYKSTEELEEDEPKLSQLMLELIQNSESLKHLAIYVRSGTLSLKEDVTTLKNIIEANNWDLDTSLEIVIPRHLLNT